MSACSRVMGVPEEFANRMPKEFRGKHSRWPRSGTALVRERRALHQLPAQLRQARAAVRAAPELRLQLLQRVEGGDLGLGHVVAIADDAAARGDGRRRAKISDLCLPLP